MQAKIYLVTSPIVTENNGKVNKEVHVGSSTFVTSDDEYVDVDSYLQFSDIETQR